MGWVFSESRPLFDPGSISTQPGPADLGQIPFDSLHSSECSGFRGRLVYTVLSFVQSVQERLFLLPHLSQLLQFILFGLQFFTNSITNYNNKYIFDIFVTNCVLTIYFRILFLLVDLNNMFKVGYNVNCIE